MGIDASESLGANQNPERAPSAGKPSSPGNRPVRWLAGHRWLVNLVLLAYVGALFTSTHVPLPQLDQLPPHSDKWLHTIAYAGLAWLIGLWIASARELRAKHYLAVLGVCAVYSVLDEFLQIFVGRHADVYDGLADVLGSVSGLVVLALTLGLLRRLFRVRA